MKNVIISAFGSSMLEGITGVANPLDRWYNILHRKLSSHFPEVCFSIINAGIGGESTREMMRRFDREVVAHSPDFCLVKFEGNNCDLARPERLVGEAEKLQLMERFVSGLPAKTKVIAVLQGPVINEKHHSWRHPAFAEANRHGGIGGLLATERDYSREFARKHGWPICDLHGMIGDKAEQYLLEDGIHLNPRGTELFADTLFEILKELLQENK